MPFTMGGFLCKAREETARAFKHAKRPPRWIRERCRPMRQGEGRCRPHGIERRQPEDGAGMGRVVPGSREEPAASLQHSVPAKQSTYARWDCRVAWVDGRNSASSRTPTASSTIQMSRLRRPLLFGHEGQGYRCQKSLSGHGLRGPGLGWGSVALHETFGIARTWATKAPRRSEGVTARSSRSARGMPRGAPHLRLFPRRRPHRRHG